MDATQSIFDLTHHRKGEKLVQGILLYLLRGDAPFRRAFCEWFGWAECCSAKEEVKEAKHRHDLWLELKEGNPKRIELKLWAGWTEAQWVDPGAIDVAIVPRAKKAEAEGLFGQGNVKTWEELMKEVAPRSDFASQLLDGLEEYTWTSQYLPRKVLVEEIENWKRGVCGPFLGDGFLNQCQSEAQRLGLRSNGSSKMYERHG